MNQTPLRLLIHGASGRMGQALLRLAAEHPETLQIVAAVTGRAPAQRVVDGVPFFAASELPGAPAFDVAIDFSLPEGFDPLLALCVERGAGLVSGTTGISSSQRQALEAAATTIPLVWASNFSLGVAVLDELVERAAQALAGWDCDVVESHHTQKKDAPSGTALTLGAAAQRGGRSRITPACVPATSWASIWCSSPGWASASSWCTGPPTATSLPAARCSPPASCRDGPRAAIGCGTCCSKAG